MEHRLIYERMMLKAFGLKRRKEVRFADADFFDMHQGEAISNMMTAALCIFKMQGSNNEEWISFAIAYLESHLNDDSAIFKVLEELPIEYQY